MPGYLIAILFAVCFLFSGCGWLLSEQTVSDDIEQDAKSGIPFSVKDPERFSAEVIVKTYAGDNVLTSVYFVAKDGKNRLEKFSVGKEGEFSILITENTGSYRLFPAEKQFEELKNSTLAESSDSLGKSMTSRWLNADKPVSFVDLGKDNGLKKYQAKIEGSKNTEIIIFIDEKLNYPVRQEIWSVKDGKRDLFYSMEFGDISLEPDPSLFVVPKDYTPKPPSQKTKSDK